MSFPASPVLNEVFIADGKAWRWDGVNWVIPKKPLPEWDEIRSKPEYFLGKVVVSDIPPANAVEGTIWFDATNERQYTYQQGLWIDPTVAVRTRYISVDPDVVNYIEAVEAADGEPLEQEVVTALEAFILGCKVDGIWDSIKASCILAGARTIAGATTPLKGLNPSYGTLSDYNRKTGYLGTGFGLNRNNNAEAQNDRHMSVFITEPSDTAFRRTLIGNQFPYIGATFIMASDADSPNYIVNISSSNQNTIISGSVGNASNAANTSIGFLGLNRNNSADFVFRANSINETIINSSYNPRNIGLTLSAANTNTNPGSQRTAFYSVGESIDLALLDNRVTKLMTKLNTILP